MLIGKHIRKIVIAFLFSVGVQTVFAAFSFTGITDEKTKNSKYSLKNLSSLSHKSLSYTSLRSTLQFKGVQAIQPKETQGGFEISSMLRYDNGNTAYIYPYKFKVKVPRFKTPSPDHH
ncbi:MAG: hypothetical protein NVSMB63_14370 [Sediminibacterium sp.]